MSSTVVAYKEIISEAQFFHIAYAMIALPSALVLARIGIQVWKRKAMELQDYLLYLAYAFFLTISICYLFMVPTVFAVGKVKMKAMKPWPTFEADLIFYFRLLYITTNGFWLTLWSVKFSLLALYKKLLEGLPRVYKRLWWAVIVFCIVVSAFRRMLFAPAKIRHLVIDRLYHLLFYLLPQLQRHDE